MSNLKNCNRLTAWKLNRIVVALVHCLINCVNNVDSDLFQLIVLIHHQACHICVEK